MSALPPSYRTAAFLRRTRLAARTAVVGLVAMLAAPPAIAALVLTDIAVFSTNADGNVWESLIWNTRGKPEDVPDRFNLYVSTSTNPGTPALINDRNGAETRIAIALAPSATPYTFGLYGNGVGRVLPDALHYVINLYFDDGTVASISGLDGPSCAGVCAATHPNGMDLYGNAGTPEAGTLTAVFGDVRVALTGFDWSTQALPGLDVVWRNWGDDLQYSNGGDGPDHFGTFSLTVSSVPVPWTSALLGIGALAMVGASRRRRRDARG